MHVRESRVCDWFNMIICKNHARIMQLVKNHILKCISSLPMFILSMFLILFQDTQNGTYFNAVGADDIACEYTLIVFSRTRSEKLI